jgi:hypothetical protein
MVSPVTTHPILPTGYNSWEINGDELNGAGVNEPSWPAYFDSFMPLKPLLMTEDMQNVFGDCADITFPCPDNVIDFSYPNDLYQVGGNWPTFVPPRGS